jgi:hypothetical protein
MDPNEEGIGDWGLGIRAWGLGIAAGVGAGGWGLGASRGVSHASARSTTARRRTLRFETLGRIGIARDLIVVGVETWARPKRRSSTNAPTNAAVCPRAP